MTSDDLENHFFVSTRKFVDLAHLLRLSLRSRQSVDLSRFHSLSFASSYLALCMSLSLRLMQLVERSLISLLSKESRKSRSLLENAGHSVHCQHIFYRKLFVRAYRIALYKIRCKMVVFEEKNPANIDDFFGFKTQFVQKVIFADLTFITPSCEKTLFFRKKTVKFWVPAKGLAHFGLPIRYKFLKKVKKSGRMGCL